MDRKRIVKSIASAGAILGGMSLFQDSGAVYAAELEEMQQENMDEMLGELGASASTSFSENVMMSEKMSENQTMAASETATSERADETLSSSETFEKAVTVSKTVYSAERPSNHGMEAHYEEEWLPTHGYRGSGSWELTRKAVERACADEGLELTQEQLNEGANVWFYSGVTLLFYGAQYGTGWDAFVSWFESFSGGNQPSFNTEEPENISVSLSAGSETSASESLAEGRLDMSDASETAVYEAGTVDDAAQEEEMPPLAVEEL